MSRLWNTRRAAILPNSRLVTFYSNGVFHALACDSAGEIALHTIDDNIKYEDIAAITAADELTNVGQMQLSNPFVLLPTLFENAALTGLLEPEIQSILLEKGLTLKVGSCSGEKSFHAIVPLYHIAKKAAETHAFLVYSCLIDKTLLVLFFRNGFCELANVYEAKNDSDVLYFSVAPIKKAGLTVDQVHFEFLTDTETSKLLLRTAGRFLPNATAARIELPYISGEYPPFAPIAYLMYQFLQCELPEVH